MFLSEKQPVITEDKCLLLFCFFIYASYIGAGGEAGAEAEAVQEADGGR